MFKNYTVGEGRRENQVQAGRWGQESQGKSLRPQIQGPEVVVKGLLYMVLSGLQVLGVRGSRVQGLVQNLGIKNLGAVQVLGIRVGLQGSSTVQGLASGFGIQDPGMQGLDGGAGSEVHSPG